MEDQLAELEKANLDAEAAADQAVKDFEEVKAVISKLDESRFVMNKLIEFGSISMDFNGFQWSPTHPKRPNAKKQQICRMRRLWTMT